jgi:hypothetical protein
MPIEPSHNVRTFASILASVCDCCLIAAENSSFLSFFSTRRACRPAFTTRFRSLLSSADSLRGRRVVMPNTVFTSWDERSNQSVPAAFLTGKSWVSSRPEVSLTSRGNPVLGSNRILGPFRSSRALINRGWFSRFVYVAGKPMND